MSQVAYRVLEVDELGVDDAAVCDFIDRNWKRRVAISLPRFHAWQFRENPSDEGSNRSLVVVDGRDQLCGFMGVTGREVHLCGRARRGAELTTWVVSEELRGRGLGKTIVRNLQENYEVILGMGISDSALAIYMRHGFKYLRYLPRYVRVLDPEAIAPISQLAPLGEKRIREQPPLDPVKHDWARIGMAEAAQLGSALRQRVDCGTRSAAYLDWRYTRHPVYHYQAFRVDHEGGSLAIIVRIDRAGDLSIVHVVDILGEPSCVPAAISFLEGFCRDARAHLSDFYCSLPQIGHLFWQAGWFSSVDDFYVQVPNWFHPVDMRVPPTTSLILWAREEMGSLIDQSRLFVTKGDCDMDRPTVTYLEEHDIRL